MNPDFLEIFKQMSFLSSVLAGFAITAAIQLILVTRKKPVVTATIVLFIISSVTSAAATFIFVIVMTAAIGPPGFPQPDEDWFMHFIGGIGILPMAGLLFFLAGVGLVGWLRSRVLGIITTIAALTAATLVVFMLISMST